MVLKMNNKDHHFSFIESLTSEKRDPYQHQHFQAIIDDLKRLEDWMRENHMENSWSLQEKLSFLRNVESTIRTGAAVRRTQLAWLAVALGTIIALVGFLISFS